MVERDLVVHAGDAELRRHVVADEPGVRVRERVPNGAPARWLRGDRVRRSTEVLDALAAITAGLLLDRVDRAGEERGIDGRLGALGDRHQLAVLQGVELPGRVHDVRPGAGAGLAVDVGTVGHLAGDAGGGHLVHEPVTELHLALEQRVARGVDPPDGRHLAVQVGSGPIASGVEVGCARVVPANPAVNVEVDEVDGFLLQDILDRARVNHGVLAGGGLVSGHAVGDVAAVLRVHRQVLDSAQATLQAASFVAMHGEREEQGLFAGVGHLVIGELDHEDVEPVVRVCGVVGADAVRPHAHRVRVAVPLLEREDGDPSRVELREVLDAVLVLAEARRVGRELDVVFGDRGLREHPVAADRAGQTTHVAVSADGGGRGAGGAQEQGAAQHGGGGEGAEQLQGRPP